MHDTTSAPFVFGPLAAEFFNDPPTRSRCTGTQRPCTDERPGMCVLAQFEDISRTLRDEAAYSVLSHHCPAAFWLRATVLHGTGRIVSTASTARVEA